jgi:hypothetical protein
MTDGRDIEIPWMLARLPRTGVVLSVGVRDAAHLASLEQPGRKLHCLDTHDFSAALPQRAVFFRQSLIGNTLPRTCYDAVLLFSVVEHCGLPCDGQPPFHEGDRLALSETRSLLRPGGVALVTVPAGQSKVTTWYRQYSPTDLRELFVGWHAEFTFWGFDGNAYTPIPEAEVPQHDYRDRVGMDAGAGSLAAILARAD